MDKIFISYRRSDSSGHVDRLRERLERRFGKSRVFVDIDDIPPGADFVAAIDAALQQSGVALVIIGPTWISANNEQGVARLTDPKDHVRREVEAALTSALTVIPVLVDGAQMPSAAVLPQSLVPLTRRQALELRRREYDESLRVLFRAIDAAVKRPNRGIIPPLVSSVAAATLVVAAGVLLQWTSPEQQGVAPASTATLLAVEKVSTHAAAPSQGVVTLVPTATSAQANVVPSPTSALQPAFREPVDAIQAHYALIDTNNFSESYFIMAAVLRERVPQEQYSNWWPNKVSREALSVRLLSITESRATVEGIVNAVDRIGGRIEQRTITERFEMVFEDGGWRIESVDVPIATHSASPSPRSEPPVSTPELTSPPPPPSPTGLDESVQRVRVVARERIDVNMRERPGTAAPVVKLTSVGTVLLVIGPDQQSGGRARRNVRDETGVEGWIVSDFLEPAN